MTLYLKMRDRASAAHESNWQSKAVATLEKVANAKDKKELTEKTLADQIQKNLDSAKELETKADGFFYS